MPSSLADFDILYTIGSGSYGTCKKIRRKSDGKVFVWKEMDYGCMTETEKQMLVSEVNLLRELKHENIVRYHERVVDKHRQILYLIMEYCEGGDLAALIRRYQREGRQFDEETVWKVLAQCASALNECHLRKDGKSILHRDLKPANIFLDSQKNVKLGDFGLARVLHETSFAKTFVGTPYYMSPEQMNKQSYNEKSDIWSLGCVLYEMCTLRPPFLASNQRELAVKIRLGHHSKIPSKYSRELCELIDSMLSVQCARRPSIDDLLVKPLVSKHLTTSTAPAGRSPPAVVAQASGDVVGRRLAELSLREHKCSQRETRVRSREAELQSLELRLRVREQELQAREQEVERRACELADKESLKQRKALTEQDVNQLCVDAGKDTADKPLTPILCHARKACDSPSKHVSFQDKENLNADSRPDGDATSIAQRAEDALQAFQRKELRQRLEKAKQRATQLRAYELRNHAKLASILNVR